MQTPRVFISYSWDDSANHNAWVLRLAEILVENGVDARIDTWGVVPGASFTQFMEQEVSAADYIIAVCTPLFALKSNARAGGVGYEQQIVSGRLIVDNDRSKFIPILRSGTYFGSNCAIPTHFTGTAAIDFRNDAHFEESIETLLRAIYNKPKFGPPPLGKVPNYTTWTTKNYSPGNQRSTSSPSAKDSPPTNKKDQSAKEETKQNDIISIEKNRITGNALFISIAAISLTVVSVFVSATPLISPSDIPGAWLRDKFVSLKYSMKYNGTAYLITPGDIGAYGERTIDLTGASCEEIDDKYSINIPRNAFYSITPKEYPSKVRFWGSFTRSNGRFVNSVGEDGFLLSVLLDELIHNDKPTYPGKAIRTSKRLDFCGTGSIIIKYYHENNSVSVGRP